MKIKKILYLVCLIFIVLVLTMNTYVQATSLTSIIQDGKDFTSGEIEDKVQISVKSSDLQAVANIINNVFLTVAIIAAFISIALMGINFMVQSTEEKAKIKESMIPFCIGAIVSFGAFGIWKIAISIFSSL